MKKAAFLLTSLVSLSLLLSACQPEDKDLAGDPAVADKCPRCKIKGKPQTKQTGKGFSIGFFAFSALMMEKEVEAIQLTRFALGFENAATAGFKVDNSPAPGLTTLTTDPAAKEYETEQGTFKTSLRKMYTVSIPTDVSAGVLAEVAGAKLIQSVDRLDRKNFINFGDSSYLLKVENSKTASDEVIITLKSNSSWKMGDHMGMSSVNEFSLDLNLVVDKESLKTTTVKILNARYNLASQNSNKPVVIKLEGSNHEVVSNGQCYSLTGESTILTDKNKKKMSYKDSAAQVVGSSYKASAADCESRPTVDLSRLFIY